MGRLPALLVLQEEVELLGFQAPAFQVLEGGELDRGRLGLVGVGEDHRVYLAALAVGPLRLGGTV